MSFFVSKMRRILIVEGVLVIASLLLFLLPLKNYSLKLPTWELTFEP